jgi:2-phosphosulfolactate phosphatase
MEIVIESLLDGAQRASGSVAVIDVLRAFTTAAVVLANGASCITMVGTVQEALALRDNGDADVCIGEVGGRAPSSFDFGNSPHEVSRVSFQGQRIVQRTSAGTQGIIAASHSAGLYAASLVTAKATARVLLARSVGKITLVAMGSNGTTRTDEDELCALHIRNLLEGRTGDREAVRQLILAGGEAVRYRDPSGSYLNAGDLQIALDIDRYDFAIRVAVVNGRPVARVD